ncbi:MAG: peptide-methionine (R)-S-oxide reductase MsrB [Chthonomonas sp.]|nr:peptide-methionine (R)-S-oxide reductase MsrB [Chthonomonas sp.]
MKLVIAGLSLAALAIGVAAIQQGSTASPATQTKSNTKGHYDKEAKLYIAEESPKRKDKVVKTDAEWKKILTPEQFKILRSHGTEPAFCGIFHDNKKTGQYNCAGCQLPLFKSDAKFDSGTGWPSFFQPFDKDNVWMRTDRSYGMTRYEVLCARCDGHLGHVFPDGPEPTGLRFCINSDGLVFSEKK